MDVADLTRDLVAIPSHQDETDAGAFVADWLREHTDAAVEVDQHGNVFGRVGAGEETLALTGHHDVVAPADSQVRDATGSGADAADAPVYLVEERDGRLYGRGTADMKGSLAAMLCAFRDVDPETLDCELVVASFVAEEDGALGSKWAVADGFAPDYAVVGEGSTGYSAPGVTDVAVAHKGRRGSTITAAGEAAHASETEAGINAIYRATDAVDVVRDLPAPAATVLGHDVTGSVAVTEIEGGSAWNVIPDACSVTVDERTVPGDRAPLERVESIQGVEWTVDQDLPPMACGDAEFADLALEVATEVQSGEGGPSEEDRGSDSGGPPEHVVKPHATDAGRLAAAGTDCLVIGAAELGEAHTADESVSLDDLDRCSEIYRGIAERV